MALPIIIYHAAKAVAAGVVLTGILSLERENKRQRAALQRIIKLTKPVKRAYKRVQQGK